MREESRGLVVTVVLRTPKRVAGFPLALWDLPRAWKPGSAWWSVDGHARFVPVRAFYTGNLCGVLVVNGRPGVSVYRLLIRTPARAPVSQDVAVMGVRGKVFVREGTPMAYLWPTRPWDTSIDLDVPVGRTVQYYAAPDGQRVDLAAGRHRLVIRQERWSRVVGLTQNELARALSAVHVATRSHPKLSACGP